jgi:hypothetical protein
VSFIKGKFYAVGLNGRISVSSDGLTWSDQPSSGLFSDSLYSIASDSDYLVAAGEGGRIIRSSDGVNWQQVAVLNNTLHSVIHIDGTLAYPGGPGYNQVCHTHWHTH